MRLAARGAREVAGGGVELIKDADQVRQVRAQARRVHVEAVIAATLVTGLTMLAAAWRT